MPMRALVVLLVVLNLGIAAWWLSRPAPSPPPMPAQPDGVPRLQLLSEAGSSSAASTAPTPPSATTQGATDPASAEATGDDASAADAAADASPDTAAIANPDASPVADADSTAAATPPRCFAAGPFADTSTRDAARSALAARGATAITARESIDAARGWRVAIAPLADRPAAEAVADRIRDAGFDDYMIVPDGSADANGIALGRYGSERAARQREAALRGAGFAAATAQPIGDVATRHWLDLRAPAGVDPAAPGITLAARDCGA